MAIVETRKLTKEFDGGVKVLKDIDIGPSDGDGKVLVRPGPSGCGKTTLLRMMGGSAGSERSGGR